MAAAERHYILFYVYVEEILERRGPYRDGHLAHLREWRDAGAVVMGGALGDPPHGAAIVFAVDDPADIERFAREDPYVEAGLVAARRIEPWTLV